MYELRPIVWIPFGLLSAAIFLASVVVHVLSFEPEPWIRMGLVWPIQIAIFIPFVAMVCFARLQRAPGPNVTPWFLRGSRPDEGPRSFVRLVPVWLWVPIGLLIGYAVYVIAVWLAVEGSPGVIDGDYVMHQKDRVLRVLTLDEFRKAQALVARGFSGQWMIFSGAPLVYFGVIQPRRRRREAELEMADAG